MKSNPGRKLLPSAIRLAAITGIALAVLAAGCGRSKIAQEVRDLRFAGQADSSRALALASLKKKASRMDLWLEFTRSTLDIVRLRPETADHTNDLDLLVQAALTGAAIYQRDKHNPSAEWRDTDKLLAGEVGRQMNTLMTTMTVQVQQASYLKPLLNPTGPDSLVPHGPDIRARDTLSGYRTDARNVLFWSIVLKRLLEMLPEVNPGTASLLAGQMDEDKAAWTQALELDPSYIVTVQQRAREAIDQALDHAAQDLKDLGYFLPQTIIENGVSQ
jgi:hypothetical protein